MLELPLNAGQIIHGQRQRAAYVFQPPPFLTAKFGKLVAGQWLLQFGKHSKVNMIVAQYETQADAVECY